MTRLRRGGIAVLALLVLGLAALRCPPLPTGGAGTRVDLPGLSEEVRVIVDRFGIPHVFAKNDADLVRVQGYLHARDRLFQMDMTRRQVDGTLAELLGERALNGDIQVRTLGLHRAAQRSLDAFDPDTVALLGAYAEGVNQYIDEAETAGTLPPEYEALELTRVRRWEPLDTVIVGKGLAARLSLDIDLGLLEELEATIAAGEAASPPFDGAALFAEDVRRVAPMDPAAMVPDATGTVPFLVRSAPAAGARLARTIRARRDAMRLARGGGRGAAPPRRAQPARDLARAGRVAERLRAFSSSRLLADALTRREQEVGSNEWGVTGEVTDVGFPILANDPHLSLDMPATFYEIHLVVEDDPVAGPLNLHGVGIGGAPLVLQGQNPWITFGSTTNPMDVTDVFDDRLVVSDDPRCAPSRMCIVSEGELHRVDAKLVSYRVNRPDDGVPDNLAPADLPITSLVVLTVPFRSFGPVIDIDDAQPVLDALFGGPAGAETRVRVLQYVGFHATREVETFKIWARARNLDDFREGLRRFDFGSQNWSYADAEGHLAIFTSGELPLRRDLEAGDLETCNPPFFVRDGSGPCNWVPDPARSQGQTIPFAVLPEDEMPQVVDPPAGFVVNANNDPAGVSLDNDPLNQRRPGNPDAIYYLNPGYAMGLRAGRITRLLRDAVGSGEPVTADAMKRFQANTQQLDAELLVPFLLDAFDRAGRPGAPGELAALALDPRVAEAVGRLEAWDFSTPTGIPEGYDAEDTGGSRIPVVGPGEAARSVAATIYNVWRAKAIRRIVDARLAALGVPGVGSGDALKALHHLLDQDPFTGVGASGVDFFPEPASLPEPLDRRAFALLGALVDALDALASDDFAEAFGRSTEQDDYRWGRLHRITFDHPLRPEWSIPPFGGFEDLAPGLPGLPRDGGYNVVNASGFSARADRENDFRFGGGPNRRYVGVAGGGPFPDARVQGFTALPGGTSGVPGDPLYAQELARWLTADYHPVEMFASQAARSARSVTTFAPPTGD